MKLIPRLKEGEVYPSAWSAEWMNMLVDTCNAVRQMRGEGGARVLHADAGIVIFSSGSYSISGSVVSGSLTGSITTIYDRSDVWL